VISGSRFVAAAKVVHIWQDDVDLAVPESSLWTGLSDQRVQHRTPQIGERKVSRVIALYEIPDEQVLGGGMGHACLHPIRVGSSTRSGTVSSAAIVSVVGGVAMINAAYQHLATTGQLESW
jgi:hypothetical protein